MYWLDRQDSNLRMLGPKPSALPLGDGPILNLILPHFIFLVNIEYVLYNIDIVEDFLKKTYPFFLSLGLVFFAVFFLSLLNTGLGFAGFFMTAIFVTLIYIFIKNKTKIIKFFKTHPKLFKNLCYILIGLGLIARLSFLFLTPNIEPNNYLTDTTVQFGGASQIVETGTLDQTVGEYDNVFPFIHTYTLTLSIFMRVFGQNYTAVIISNTLFDILSGIVIYILIKLWRKKSSLALLAAALWAINPLQIIFCALPMPIIVVNLFVVLTILCVFLLFTNIKNLKRFLIVAFYTGIVLALGNNYRPIFIVFLIALICTIILRALNNHSEIKRLSLATAIIILTFGLVGLIQKPIFTSVNPYYKGTSSNGGWSFFVGSNYQTAGSWNDKDYDTFEQILASSNQNVPLAHSEMFNRGVNRYLDLASEHKIFKHLLNKFNVLFVDIKSITYNLEYVFNISKPFIDVTKNLIAAFYYLLMLGATSFFVKSFKKPTYRKHAYFVCFVVISIVGFCSSALLVETMSRYVMPLIPMLMVLL